MLTPPPSIGTSPAHELLKNLPLVHWTEAGLPCSAHWRSERAAPAPKRVALADDTMTADAAYTLACAGTALLWRGDFHNARQLLQALVRRIDRTPRRKQRAEAGRKNDSPADQAQAFNAYRQAKSQRARILAMVLLPFNADYSIALRRAPDARLACIEAWGESDPDGGGSVASLRDLMGMTSAHEWRKKGVEVGALGAPPNNRIYPHYGVFSPVRGEYIALVAAATLPAMAADTPASDRRAFDIGVGSGVLSAVLARTHGLQVVATDQDPRALACANANITQLGLQAHVTVLKQSMFPVGLAQVIVCNPPWLPARPSAPIEHAVYDEGSRMLNAFLAGLAAHLTAGGEGWLILSNLAELLGLRTREELLSAVEAGGLIVLGCTDAKPLHAKALDVSNALFSARSKEVTSLWRLGVKPESVAA